uniref:Uncharacterized protein n=1 Tax=Oryza meridionalis TaxID=40149 RepID=A0A0E0CXR8_9ORYZ
MAAMLATITVHGCAPYSQLSQSPRSSLLPKPTFILPPRRVSRSNQHSCPFSSSTTHSDCKCLLQHACTTAASNACLAAGTSAGEPEPRDSTLNQFTEYNVAARRNPSIELSRDRDGHEDQDAVVASCWMRCLGCMNPSLCTEWESGVVGSATGSRETCSAFSPEGKKTTRDREEQGARRTASRLEGAGKGGDGAVSSAPERGSRSAKGRKEVERTKWRRRWRRPRREGCGGWKGEGRARSVACGGSGEKRRGPYDAAAAEDVARDGGAKTEETGKRKRQSSERFIAGGAGGHGRARAALRRDAGE